MTFTTVLTSHIRQLMILLDQSNPDEPPKDLTAFMEMVIARVAENTPPRWICFHCGFETNDSEEAAAHFGDRDDGEEFKPLCNWWSTLSQETRATEIQELIQQNNELQSRSNRLIAENEGLEYRLTDRENEIKSYKPFKDCRSIRDIFNVYDSTEGEMLAAKERLTIVEESLEALRLSYADSIARAAIGVGNAIQALQEAARGLEGDITKRIPNPIFCPRCGVGVRLEAGRCEFCHNREECETCHRIMCECDDKEKVFPSVQ
jgi:hypothetical protein